MSTDLPFDPRSAVDLSDLKGKTSAKPVDLSKQASEERDRLRRMEAAGKWARTMTRTFKGITGAPRRRDHVRKAIRDFNLA